MKISGAIIQNRLIITNTAKNFEAAYKKHRISITTDHGFGKPIYDHLTRYFIVVKGEDGMYAVDACQDLHTMEDAIRFALKGACLIK